jgi:hypothetical protein
MVLAYAYIDTKSCRVLCYLRRLFFTRSAKLLGSGGLASVHETLPCPNASRGLVCFAVLPRCE